MSLRPALMAAVVLLAACGGDGAKGSVDPAGLVTVIDSTADTVSASTAGDVPAAAVRTLVQEMAIAPGLDDTTLFTDVRELRVDGQGRMWVYDPGPKQILLFAPTGTLLKRIGRSGAGPGEFASDGGMAVLGDSGLAIWDSQNARITFIDSSGTYTHSWPTPGGFNTSAGLITDRTGALFMKPPVTQNFDRKWKSLHVKAATVDSFQGREADVVLYTLVRSGSAERKFLADGRRFNVALSRAKSLLVMVGDRTGARGTPRLQQFLSMIPEENQVSATLFAPAGTLGAALGAALNKERKGRK